MIKKVLLFFICFGCCACYQYKDLNDLAIVSGMSISYNKNNYNVMVEVVNPKKQQDASSSGEKDFIIYQGNNNSIQDAVKEVIRKSSKHLYMAHMNLVIIDESVLSGHLDSVLDYFSRHAEVRDEFLILIGRSKDIISINNQPTDISSDSILDSLKLNTDYFGYSSLISFQDLLSIYMNPYRDIAISSVKVSDDKTSISDIGVFSDNMLVGYLKEEDSLVYNIISGKANHFFINNNEVYRDKLSIKIDANNINIYIKGRVNLVGCDNSLDEFNDYFEKLISHSVSDVIHKYNSDIYGFEDILYSDRPKYVESVHSKWKDSILPNFNIRVFSDMKTMHKNNLNGGIYDKA